MTDTAKFIISAFISLSIICQTYNLFILADVKKDIRINNKLIIENIIRQNKGDYKNEIGRASCRERV